jgi:hypothetical protein
MPFARISASLASFVILSMRGTLPQPHTRLSAIGEFDASGFKGQDDLCDGVTVSRGVSLRACDGVSMDTGLLSKLPDRPVQKRPCRS